MKQGRTEKVVKRRRVVAEERHNKKFSGTRYKVWICEKPMRYAQPVAGHISSSCLESLQVMPSLCESELHGSTVTPLSRGVAYHIYCVTTEEKRSVRTYFIVDKVLSGIHDTAQ